MSRRFDGYCKLVEQFEHIIPEFIEQYIVFVNDDKLKSLYKSLENQNKKVKCVFANENFVFKNGHDTVYNYLDSLVQSEWILKLFDTDRIELDIELFKKEFEGLNNKINIYGIPTFMQRGEVWENKYQLYKKGIANWYGILHENLEFNVQLITYDLKSLKVFHENGIDNKSLDVKKTEDGFIILEETFSGEDSHERNVLYESLGYKIVFEGGRHRNRDWFVRNFEINKNLILKYVEEAKKRWQN
jgi:hypothetical protein